MRENKKSRGSATVIVIVMFSITLILAIATTFIAIDQNNKSKKIAQWNSDFYNVDAQAVHFEFKMKEALIQAEQKTIEYMYNKEYEKPSSDYLPQYVQTKVYDYFKLDNKYEDKLNITISRLYFFYANAYLEDLVNEVPGILIMKNNDGIVIFDLQARCTFKSENDLKLEVVQEINKINYDIVVNSNQDVTYTKARNQYFTTTSYFVSQPLKE